jgi:hypothetical protein
MGLAVMVTVGAERDEDGLEGADPLEKLPDLAPPQPMTPRNRENSNIGAEGGEIL